MKHRLIQGTALIFFALFIVFGARLFSVPDLDLTQYEFDLAQFEHPDNLLTPEKIELGRILFFDTIQNASCAQCHLPEFGFSSEEAQSIGGPGDTPPITANNVILSHTQQVQLWNGKAGFGGPNEGLVWDDTSDLAYNNNYGMPGTWAQKMFAQSVKAHSMSVIVADLKNDPVYLDLYQKAYPMITNVNSLITDINTASALSAFEQSLIPSNSKFQRAVRGEAVLSSREKKGLRIIQKGCQEGCHEPPYFNSMTFHRLFSDHLVSEFNDGSAAVNVGRMGVTGNREDFEKFKTPTLYHAFDKTHYMHGGAHKTISDAITVGHEIDLSNNELMYVAEFIETLTDPELKKIK